MKALAPPLLAILLLAFHYACLAQTPADNSEPKSRSRGGVYPPPAESGDVVVEENNEVQQLSPAEQAFERASEHAQKNELKEAIADCNEAVRLDPGNSSYLFTRAKFYQETGNFDKGLEDADKILEADPNDVHARVLRGTILELSGKPDKALTEFNIAVERNPTSVEALVARNGYFQRQGERDMAISDADKIIQLQPDSPVGYRTREETHTTFREFDQAENYEHGLVQPDREEWEVYVTRGLDRASKGDYAGANGDFETALSLSPNNAIVLSSRAACYFEAGDYEKSLSDMEKAVELRPEDAFVNAHIAQLLAICPDERIRNGEKATHYAAQAIRLAPDDPFVWRACAAAAAESGNFEEAIKWQQRVIASTDLPSTQQNNQRRLEAYKAGKPYRDNFPMRNAYGKAYDAVKSDDFDREIALLSEVIAVNPKDTDARFIRGYAYNMLKKYDLAIADLSVAIAADPQNVYALDERGRAYNNLNKYDLAIIDLSVAIAVNPKDTDARRYRGFAYDRVKKYDAAIADLSAAIERNPKDVDAHYWRSHAFYQTRQYGRAIDDLEQTEALSTQRMTDVLNGLAWIHSVCPDHHFRDSSKAAEYMERALEEKPDDPFLWDTCAAVFAEDDDFDDAIDWEQACIDSKDISDEVRRDWQKRLQLYRRHLPYRDEPDTPSTELASSAARREPEN